MVVAHLAVARFAANRPARCQADRDEMLSAAYWGLCNAARSFDERRGFQFKTYARDCCRNAVSAYLRGRRRFPDLDSDAVATAIDRQPDPAEQAGQNEIFAALRAAIRTLPARQRDVLMGILDGRSYRDIGADLGVSETRVCGIRAEAIVTMLVSTK